MPGGNARGSYAYIVIGRSAMVGRAGASSVGIGGSDFSLAAELVLRETSNRSGSGGIGGTCSGLMTLCRRLGSEATECSFQSPDPDGLLLFASSVFSVRESS